jgi:hypothetical protein
VAGAAPARRARARPRPQAAAAGPGAAAGAAAPILPRVAAALGSPGGRAGEPWRLQAARLWRRWSSGPDPGLLLAPAPSVLAHGDPSPANYLWDGRRVVLVDFEDAGWRDRAVELADLVEHAQSRNTPAAAWGRVLDRLGLDGRERARHRAARRLFGLFWLFWLTLLDRPGADLSPAAQLERVGGLLAGDDGYCR